MKKNQHAQPCLECPWRRASLPKWLGGYSAQLFLCIAHSDCVQPCHTKRGMQCAGMAIYRSNVCKSSSGSMLELPANKLLVFDGAAQFSAHHGEKNCPQILPVAMLPEFEALVKKRHKKTRK